MVFRRHRGKHVISWLGTAFGDHGNSKRLSDIQNPPPPPTVIAFAFCFRGKDSCHICLGHPLCQQIPFLCQQNVNVSFFSPTSENNECVMMLVRFFLISTISQQVPHRRTFHTDCHTCQIPGVHTLCCIICIHSVEVQRSRLRCEPASSWAFQREKQADQWGSGTQPISVVKTS